MPLNIHTDPSKRGVYYSLNPGKYDHEAIKYGYMHVEGEVTGEQHESLREHAASLPAGESGAPRHHSPFFTFGLEANSTWLFAL